MHSKIYEELKQEMFNELPFEIKEVIINSIVWWEGKRPVGWSEDKHLEFPTINCTGGQFDKVLALTVSKFVSNQKKELIEKIKKEFDKGI